MLRIINCLTDSKKVPENGTFVHPFYRDTFVALYGIDAEKGSEEEECCPDANLKMLLPLIKNTVKGYEDRIGFFYDVRTTEEFGYPAPEYLLLHGAGLTHISPLGVKGMKALVFPFALLLAEQEMKEGDYALVCCAQLDTPFDPGERYEAGVLLLNKIAANEGLQNRENTLILSYGHNLSEVEFADYQKVYPAKAVCCDPDGFGMFFEQLVQLPAEEERIFSWNWKGRLGYLHIWKGAAE